MNSRETAVQLMARLIARPNIESLDEVLFKDGLTMGDLLMISGEPSTGKSLLLFKFIARCILPKAHKGIQIGGFEAGVMFLECDHNNSMVQLMDIIEHTLSNCHGSNLAGKTTSSESCFASEDKKYIVETALKRLIILKVYRGDTLLMNLRTISRTLSTDRKISLIAVDSINTFYWQEVIKDNGIRKMDLYLKHLVEQIVAAVRDHGVITVIIKSAYFESKSRDTKLGPFRYILDLKTNEDDGVRECLVKTPADNNKTVSLKFILGKHGLNWITE